MVAARLLALLLAVLELVLELVLGLELVRLALLVEQAAVLAAGMLVLAEVVEVVALELALASEKVLLNQPPRKPEVLVKP